MQKVAIFGVPRSGTSWLGQIFNSSPNVAYRFQPIFAYSFPEKISAESTIQDIKSFHQKLLQTDDDFVCQKENLSGNKNPQFEKTEITHLVWKEVRYLNIIENLIQQSSTKVIGIVRHPCGVIKSWIKAPREFENEWNIEEEWRYAPKKNSGHHEFYGYEKWVEATQMFINLEKKYPKQFKTTSYESLLRSPLENMKHLFDFVDLEMKSQSVSFLNESITTTSDDPYSVYRSYKSGREWVNQLSPKIITQILQDTRYTKINEFYDWHMDSLDEY